MKFGSFEYTSFCAISATVFIFFMALTIAISEKALDKNPKKIRKILWDVIRSGTALFFIAWMIIFIFIYYN